MRIAQIAPLTEAIPPKLYGGTERVVSWLTEELVALGHDVTLFASGDSVTSAKLRADVAAGAAARRFGARCLRAAHADAGTWCAAARTSSTCCISISTIIRSRCSRASATPFVTTLHGRLDLPEHQPVFDTFSAMPVVSISNSQRRPLPQANWVAHRSITACRTNSARPAAGRAELSRVPRPHLAREGRSIARSASPSAAACRSRSPPRSTRSTVTISTTEIKPLLRQPHVEYHRRDQRRREIRIPERRRWRCSFRSTGRSRSGW